MELAEELMSSSHEPPSLSSSYIPHRAGGIDRKYSGAKEWLGSRFSKNPKLFVIGGISAAVALVAVVGIAIYKKKRASEDK
jgi:hypothetical protein